MKVEPTDTIAAGNSELLSEKEATGKTWHQASNNPRIIELDVLRGIAISLVLGAHILDIPSSLSTPVQKIFFIWRELGWIGVDLFFVLSGFLVSGLLFSEFQATGKLRLGLFLLRRGLKIYPSFYVFLLVSSFTAYFFSFPIEFSKRALLGEGIFLQNYIGAFWNHTWSLAVEEHFYLLLSVIMLILIRARPDPDNPFKFIPTLVLTSCITILVLRVQAGRQFPMGFWQNVLPFTHFRIDSLFFGVLISYYSYFRNDFLIALTRRWRWIYAISVVIAFLSPIIFPLEHSRFIYSYGFSILYLGFGALLLLCLHGAWKVIPRILRKFRFLAYLGRNSYSIYLWHMFLYDIAVLIWTPTDTSPESFFLRTIAYLCGSVLVGMLTARWIEFPILYLRDRYFPSRKFR